MLAAIDSAEMQNAMQTMDAFQTTGCAPIKLNARAARIKAATAALYGEWGCQTKMAASVGISKQMLSFIIHGDRPVTDKIEKAVADALARQADRLCTTARKWDEIAGKMQRRSRNRFPDAQLHI